MLSVRIPKVMNKALGDKVKAVGMSKCQYILSLIGKDLGMLDKERPATPTPSEGSPPDLLKGA